MSQLETSDGQKPYFIAYRVHDDNNFQVTASLGAIRSQRESRDRSVEVEVRVGAYELDNTNFIRVGGRQLPRTIRTTTLPIEDDYWLIRYKLWTITDAAFKAAVDVFAAKEAALLNVNEEQTLADLSRDEPFVFSDPRENFVPDQGFIIERATRLSEIAKDYPDIYSSSIRLFYSVHRDYFLNSEGSKNDRRDDVISSTYSVTTQSESGRILSDSLQDFVRRPDELIPLSEYAEDVRSWLANVQSTRAAPEIKTYNGPILFSKQAAAQVVALVLVPALMNEKTPVFDNPAFMDMYRRIKPVNPFVARLGSRVMPRDFSVYSDPRLERFGDRVLAGNFPVDDQGIEARRTMLVERGRLKTLLRTREVYDEFSGSTGNNLAGAGPIPGNLFVETTDGITREELEEELQLLVQEECDDLNAEAEDESQALACERFGVIVERARLRGAAASLTETVSKIQLTEAYKVYVDGRRELIAPATLSQFSTNAFRDILASSDTLHVENLETRYLTGVSLVANPSQTIVSVVTPDLLFEEATIVPDEGLKPALPLLPSPLSIRASNP